MTDKYANPENTQDILKLISTLPTLGDVKPVLEETFPGWIVGGMPYYSSDYQHLQKNWEMMCKAMSVKPVQIVIVDELYFDDEHSLLQVFGDIMTQSGFCVRRKEEFFPCKKCGAALPQPGLYDIMKEKGVASLPNRWFPICTNC